MKLEDGKGTGVLAQVDGEHRLQVSSIASDRAESANIAKEAFIMACPIFAIAAGVETRISYIANGEASRNLIIDVTQYFSDGGTTSNSKPTYVNFYINASIPTSDFVDKDPVGTNTAAGQSSAEFKVWDLVGTGLVQLVPGDLLGSEIIAIGKTADKLPSKLILGPAKTLTVSFECEEAAKVGLHTYVHLL